MEAKSLKGYQRGVNQQLHNAPNFTNSMLYYWKISYKFLLLVFPVSISKVFIYITVFKFESFVW